MHETLSAIKISGDKAQNFLQGQLSNDLTLVQQGELQLNCYCNQKGRIIAFVWLTLLENDYYLCLPQSAVELTLQDLRKFGVFSKVTVELCDSLKCVGFYGQNINCFSDKILAELMIAKDFGIIMCKNFTDHSPNDYTLWLQKSIETEIPVITKALQEQFTPHQLNLQNKNALSFNKGCYRGQEIVARMQYLGKLKQSCQQVKITSEIPIEPLTKLLSLKNEPLGEVVNVCKLDDNLYLALAILNKLNLVANPTQLASGVLSW